MAGYERRPFDAIVVASLTWALCMASTCLSIAEGTDGCAAGSGWAPRRRIGRLGSFSSVEAVLAGGALGAEDAVAVVVSGAGAGFFRTGRSGGSGESVRPEPEDAVCEGAGLLPPLCVDDDESLPPRFNIGRSSLTS